MTIPFYKFDGAGNDFVVIDNRNGSFNLSHEAVEHICRRRFGVGADGLMTLCAAPAGYDFVMRYFNSDGFPADMCGNGGRCIALFAHLLGLGRAVDGLPHLSFLADDGPHEADVLQWDAEKRRGTVSLGMRDVPARGLTPVLDGHLLNTGVPHYVQEVADLQHFDVVGEGRRLRHHPALGPDGANVDFVEPQPDGSLRIRTYERGVEDETWACGTGVTACAIVTGIRNIHARGGYFTVTFDNNGGRYSDIRLTGPVSLNYIGQL